MADLVYLDEVNAIERLGGSKDMFMRLLKKFVQSLDKELSPYERVLDEATKEEFRREIHSIKGSAGSMGCTALYEAATVCEKSVIDNNPDKMLHDTFVKIYAETKAYLTSYLS